MSYGWEIRKLDDGSDHAVKKIPDLSTMGGTIFLTVWSSSKGYSCEIRIDDDPDKTLYGEYEKIKTFEEAMKKADKLIYEFAENLFNYLYDMQ